jgi:Skp family chaperone for outer membrane proteins
MASQRLDEGLERIEAQMGRLQNQLRRLDGQIGDERRTLDTDIEREIADVTNQLNRLSGDIKSVGASDRDYYQQEITKHQTELGKASQELRQKRAAYANSPEARQAEQLQRNVQRSDGIVGNLDEAIRLGNDNVTTGQHTLGVLAEDRQIIEHVDENLMHVHMEAKEGQSRIGSMARRALMHKFISWIIVVILVALLGMSIYLRFIKKD